MIDLAELRRLHRVARFDFWIAVAAILGGALGGRARGRRDRRRALARLARSTSRRARRCRCSGASAGRRCSATSTRTPATRRSPASSCCGSTAASSSRRPQALEDRVRGLAEAATAPLRALVLDLEGVNFIDSQGAEQLADDPRARREPTAATLRLARMKPNVLAVLERRRLRRPARRRSHPRQRSARRRGAARRDGVEAADEPPTATPRPVRRRTRSSRGHRRPGSGVDRRRRVSGARGGRACATGEGRDRERDRAALRGTGTAVGERHVRAARGPPGDGCGRQGLRDQARHVRRESAGCSGRFVQEAVVRGARPQLPLAHLEGAARARPHRHLQPLALRGGRRVEGPSRVARAAAPPARRAGRAVLAGALRGHQRLRAPPRPQRDEDREVLPPRLEGVQKERFIARLDRPGKEWKFNAADVAERARFDDYISAFEDALTATSTPWAPGTSSPPTNGG